MSQNFASRLAQPILARKDDIAALVKKHFDDKLKKLNKKFTSNKTKHVLVENELKQLQTIESSLCIDQRFFSMMERNFS